MANASEQVQIAFDIGGTFTDFVLHDAANGVMRFWKVPSTPDNPSRAVLAGLEDLLAASAVEVVLHATTGATNAIIERKGPKTAFVTTRGFRDILIMGRQKRYDTFDIVIGREEGRQDLLTFDMGGTTAKLGAIDGGEPAVMPTFEVATINCRPGSGIPLNISAVEMLEIGAGVGSAVGLQEADNKIDANLTRVTRIRPDAAADIAAVYRELEARVEVNLERLGRSETPSWSRYAYMRYVGQGYERKVDLPGGPIDEDYPDKVVETFVASYPVPAPVPPAT